MAFTAALLIGAVLVRAVQVEDDYTVDERGRHLRVRFDPGSRIGLGLFSTFTGGAQRLRPALELRLDLSVRSVYEYSQEDETIRWQLDHRIVSSQVGTTTTPGGLPELASTAYLGSFLRHTEFPYLTLPGDPPRRLYFPFDIGMQFEAGRLEVDGYQSGDLLRLGVVRAAVLLDPWRSGREGNSLELGLGVRYHLDILGKPGLDEGRVIHRVAPFSDLSIRFRYQDQPGLTIVDLQAHLFPHWASVGGWTFATEGLARLERVLVALNDEPLAVVIEVSGRVVDGFPAPEFRLTAGLQFGYQL